MRGSASAKRGPAVGELVPVLIRECDGEVKAILPGPDQWRDILLFSSIGLVLLMLGSL
ncbi:hypothetical protein ACQ86G_17480 [Roseateles chitinivorans]|uniref:hypothetical protein n=1 Tax=Roseateles chitinivorans TaxID=2917965 RepID=UPI003D676124